MRRAGPPRLHAAPATRIVRVVCISMKDAPESDLAVIAQQFSGEESLTDAEVAAARADG